MTNKTLVVQTVLNNFLYNNECMLKISNLSKKLNDHLDTMLVLVLTSVCAMLNA